MAIARAMNPRVLAEVKLNRVVNWDALADPTAYLTQVLGLPLTNILADPLAFQPPPFSQWLSPGQFLSGAPSFQDPCQGQVGDCYFLAALSALAWTNPNAIAWIDAGPGLRGITFYESGVPRVVITSDVVPLTFHGSFPLSSGPSAVPQCWVFARSGRVNQYWPALWEKAYATWKDHDNNTPDYGRIHGGWPATAISELTGRPAQTTTSSKFLAVQRICPLGYAICPMVASTYAGDPAVYNQGSGISGNHAYTVLGVLNENGASYVVLRNPWGWLEGNVNIPQTNAFTRMSDGLRVTLNEGGVFAIRQDSFEVLFEEVAWQT